MNEENLQNVQKDINTRIMRKGGPMTTEQRNEAMALFIESLCKDPNISLACDRSGIVRDTAYKWREKYKEFANSWEDAIERTKDTARSSIYQRAILGWEEPVLSMGQVVYEQEPVLDEDGNQKFDHKGRPLTQQGTRVTIRKYSDTLANSYAKANLPEYKEKQQIDINADIQSSSAITIDTRSMSPKQLIEFKAFALKLKEANNG